MGHIGSGNIDTAILGIPEITPSSRWFCSFSSRYSKARRTVRSSRSLASNGFCRYSKAPSFIASTAISIEPCPVMKITTAPGAVRLICGNTSRPFISGML